MPGKPRGKFSRKKKGSITSNAAERWIKGWKLATLFGNINVVDDLDENSVRGVVWTDARWES